MVVEGQAQVLKRLAILLYLIFLFVLVSMEVWPAQRSLNLRKRSMLCGLENIIGRCCIPVTRFSFNSFS